MDSTGVGMAKHGLGKRRDFNHVKIPSFSSFPPTTSSMHNAGFNVFGNGVLDLNGIWKSEKKFKACRVFKG